MPAVRGIYEEGKIVLLEPADWPEGCEVSVEPLSEVSAEPDLSEQANDPESIARWLAAFDALPKVPMSDQDWAEFDAAIAAQSANDKDYVERIVRLGESLP